MVKLLCICVALAAQFTKSTASQQQLTAQMLKQAADDLFLIRNAVQKQPSLVYAKVAEPSHLDLLVRRLQMTLDAQVADNWQAITDPQRFAILNTKDPIVQILKSFRPLKAQLDIVERNVEGSLVESQLNSLSITSMATMRRWIQQWDSLRKYIGQIGQLYSYFQAYVDRPESISKASLDEFVSSLLETRVRESLLANMLGAFHSTVLREGNSTTIFALLDAILLENDEQLCTMSQSPYQLMFNLYNILALSEIKGYTMLQFSYMTHTINQKGNFTTEAGTARRKFKSEARQKLTSVKEILPSMSRGYRTCDPSVHKEGETYLKVKGFLQGYIENEVDMNEQGTCKSKCSEYTYTESHGCYKDMFCAKQKRCKGRIFDCEFYHADAWVCMSQDPDRRYDWVEYEDGTVLGRPGQCANKIKVDSWWRYLVWHCSYCLCKCDEITDASERYWSLVPALADKQANMVITGARFVKRGKIFHLQIQQAKLLQEGGIDENVKAWKEPEKIPVDDLVTNPKIFTMSYEQRAMDLDKLSLPEGYVLTGLKLRKIGGHLNLEIEGTPVRFTTGELISQQAIWIANDNTPATGNPRKLIPLVIPDVPTRLVGQNKVDGLNDQYLQFDTSSANKDVAQTTVPFMDAQAVATSPATWLSGAGIYHRGRVGFGGFVGISLETYNFSRHLLPDLGETDDVVKVEFVKVEGV